MMAVFCKPEDRVPVYFRLKNGGLIPYVKEKIQDVNSLKRVLVGAKMVVTLPLLD